MALVAFTPILPPLTLLQENMLKSFYFKYFFNVATNPGNSQIVYMCIVYIYN